MALVVIPLGIYDPLKTCFSMMSKNHNMVRVANLTLQFFNILSFNRCHKVHKLVYNLQILVMLGPLSIWVGSTRILEKNVKVVLLHFGLTFMDNPALHILNDVSYSKTVTTYLQNQSAGSEKD